MSEDALRWERLTWCVVAARRARLDMAILPVGSTEQHGPHLALDIDTVSAERVAEAVAARTGVPVPPCVLGTALRDEFVRYERAEWEEYHQHVSDWEITRYAQSF